MPEVTLSIGKVSISRAETAPMAEARADGGGALIGELTVFLGGLLWLASHMKSVHLVHWEIFAKLMEAQEREPIA